MRFVSKSVADLNNILMSRFDSFCQNKAEQELPKHTWYLLLDFQKIKPNRGMGEEQGREEGKGGRFKSITDEFYKPRYLKFRRRGGDDCSYLHPRLRKSYLLPINDENFPKMLVLTKCFPIL